MLLKALEVTIWLAALLGTVCFVLRFMYARRGRKNKRLR
jgi:hypothetical protein